MSVATDTAIKRHSNRVMGAYEALHPFIVIARRDGPQLMSQCIAAARTDTADGTTQQTFGRQVALLKVILDTLIKLPPPEGTKEDEAFDIPSAPSPKLALMSRYRENASADTTSIPEKLQK